MSRPLAHNSVPVAPSRADRPGRGFTMAEVLFAIIILGIGLILLAAAFPIGIVQTEKVKDTTMASIVARMAYDQITKVPASGAVPLPVALPSRIWAVPPAPNTAVSTWSFLTAPQGVINYADTGMAPIPGKPMLLGFLDGTQTVAGEEGIAGGVATPDLRLKLVYPFSLYSERADNPLAVDPTLTNPTWSEDCPQHEATVAGAMVPRALGRAAFDRGPGSLTSGKRQPVPYGLVWGFRNEGNTWYENVHWVYPADRRYYWYAFYRQMYDMPFYLPYVFKPANAVHMNLLNQIQADHITRRTYRVSIVVCKVPQGQEPVQPPSVIQARWQNGDSNALPIRVVDLLDRVANNTDGKVNNRLDEVPPTTTAYSEQWTRSGLAPVRVPTVAGQDSVQGVLAYNPANGPWIRDGSGTCIADSVARGFLRRGGIILDCWGNVYQVVDVVSNQIRLDRLLVQLQAGYGYGDIRDNLPLWFNPNAIAMFPTIMTKQADMP